MLVGALLVLAAHAGGHYDPSVIARQSTAYATVADSAGQTFKQRSTRAQAVATALNDYEAGLDLLGDRAPQADRDRHAALKKTFNREKAVLQVFAQTLLEDFDGVFSQAVERAAPDGAVPCRTRIPKGKALPGMPAPMQDNPECTGTDHTAAIIEAVDADAELAAAVQEIAALEWPPITLPDQARSPVGPEARWLAVHPFMQGVLGARLEEIRRKDEEDRLFIEAAMEEEPDTTRLKGLVDDARAITRRTAKARAEAAAPVLDAIDEWNDKKAKKGLDVGWCANPERLGGCTGQDVTETVGAQILADKKVQRALP